MELANQCGSGRGRDHRWLVQQGDAANNPRLAHAVDAMIERRLVAQGKTLIDADQVARLRQAMSDLNDALGGLGN